MGIYFYFSFVLIKTVTDSNNIIIVDDCKYLTNDTRFVRRFTKYIRDLGVSHGTRVSGVRRRVQVTSLIQENSLRSVGRSVNEKKR